MFQRPAFKDGITMYKGNTTKENVENKKLIPQSRLTTQDDFLRPAFVVSQPTSRKVINFDKISELDNKLNGLKVKLGQKTLSELLGITDISISELLKNNKLKLDDIEDLLNNITTQYVSEEQSPIEEQSILGWETSEEPSSSEIQSLKEIYNEKINEVLKEYEEKKELFGENMPEEMKNYYEEQLDFWNKKYEENDSEEIQKKYEKLKNYWENISDEDDDD